MASKKKNCCCNGYCASIEFIRWPLKNSITNMANGTVVDVSTNDFSCFGLDYLYNVGYRPTPACGVGVNTYQYPTGRDAFPDIAPGNCNEALIGWPGQICSPTFRCQAVPAGQSQEYSFPTYGGNAGNVLRTYMYYTPIIEWVDENGDHHVGTGFFFQWVIDYISECFDDPFGIVTQTGQCATQEVANPNLCTAYSAFSAARGTIEQNAGIMTLSILWDDAIDFLPNPVNANRGVLWRPPDRVILECTTNISTPCSITDDISGDVTLARPQSLAKIYTSHETVGDNSGPYSNGFRFYRPDIEQVTRTRHPDGTSDESTVRFLDEIYVWLGAYG